jgi:hypothetical protein
VSCVVDSLAIASDRFEDLSQAVDETYQRRLGRLETLIAIDSLQSRTTCSRAGGGRVAG